MSKGKSTKAPCEDLDRVVIREDPEKYFQVEAQLLPCEKEELITFLKQNIDVFA